MWEDGIVSKEATRRQIREENKMAQYEINHTCGHSETVKLFGKETERRNRIAYLETMNCQACSLARRQAEGAALAAKTEAENSDLAALEGSEKQVEWARAIRAAALPYILQIAGGTPQEDAIAFCAMIRRQKSAKYWIERRQEFSSLSSLISYVKARLVARAAEAAGKVALAGK
jgi:hypothetical protein